MGLLIASILGLLGIGFYQSIIPRNTGDKQMRIPIDDMPTKLFGQLFLLFGMVGVGVLIGICLYAVYLT